MWWSRNTIKRRAKKQKKKKKQKIIIFNDCSDGEVLRPHECFVTNREMPPGVKERT